MHELETFISICSQAIASLVAIVVGFLSISKSKLARGLCLTFMVLFAAANIFLLGMGVNHFVQAASEESKRIGNAERGRNPIPEPRPSPKPEAAKVESEDKPNEPLLSFNVSSRSDRSFRALYCIDSDFSGTVSRSNDGLLVTLDTASLELCKYSSDNNRNVEIRFGFGTNEDIRRKNWRSLQWTKYAQKRMVAAGEEVDLTRDKPIVIPLNRSMQNRLSKTTAGYGVVVSVYNRDRSGLYVLTDDSN